MENQTALKTAILCTCALLAFTVFQFFLQGSIGIIADTLKEELDIDAANISLMSASFFYFYVALQIPAGFILDRLGLVRVLTISVFALGLACFLFAASTSFKIALIARMLMGICASFGFVGMLKGLELMFAPKQFPIALALAEALSMVGVAVFNYSYSITTKIVGWRTATVAGGIFAVILSFAIYRLLSKTPAVAHPKAKTKDHVKIWKSLSMLMRSKPVWLSGIYTGLTYALITSFVALWGIPYVETVFKLSNLEATKLVSLVYIGMGIGSPFVGWIAGRLPITGIMTYGALSTFLLFSGFLFFNELAFWDIALYMLILGISCSTYLVAFTMINNHVDSHIKGIAMGFTNTLCMITAPIIQITIGILLTATEGAIFDHNETYTASDYKKALLVLPVCFILAAFTGYVLHKKNKNPETVF